MSGKLKNIKMKLFIILLFFATLFMFVHRYNMADRDFANVLLEQSRARLVSESGANVLAAKISLNLQKNIPANKTINKLLNDGWLQAGTEAEARFKVTYARPKDNEPDDNPTKFDVLVEGKCGAHVYTTAAVLAITDKKCSVELTKTNSEN